MNELRGLVDTSVLIAAETNRAVAVELLPDTLLVCVITIAELKAGIYAARDTETRARRMRTLEAVASLEPLVVDATAADHWARLRVRLAESGRRINVNDLWIASVALAAGVPVVTQDDDFDVLVDLDGPAVISV